MPSSTAAAVLAASAMAPLRVDSDMRVPSSIRARPGPRRRAPRANLRAPMSDRRFDPHSIEPKWQEIWERERTWEGSNDDAGAAPKAYVLEMLADPAGAP